ncbi:hypothetical protein AB0I94_02290 [Streptomyces sp. NPDC050147]|uniref:hypothetical protein n=1 Tax=Streptomyces sp. NPDC050147 TaxID=3155513 RepID=UPI00344A236E
MADVEITIHGAITYGVDYATVNCPTCRATHSHQIRGDLGDDTVPVTLTCLNGHDVPLPDASELDPRELLFTVAMRAE